MGHHLIGYEQVTDILNCDWCLLILELRQNSYETDYLEYENTISTFHSHVIKLHLSSLLAPHNTDKGHAYHLPAAQ